MTDKERLFQWQLEELKLLRNAIDQNYREHHALSVFSITAAGAVLLAIHSKTIGLQPGGKFLASVIPLIFGVYGWFRYNSMKEFVTSLDSYINATKKYQFPCPEFENIPELHKGSGKKSRGYFWIAFSIVSICHLFYISYKTEIICNFIMILCNLIAQATA